MASSGTRLPQNRGHKSENGVFRVENDVFRLNSSSWIESKFVDFTRFLTAFCGSFGDPEYGSFGDQVARKPRPRASKQRVSKKICSDLWPRFWGNLVPELATIGASMIFRHFGSKVTILWVRDLGARGTPPPNFNMGFVCGTQGTHRYRNGVGSGRLLAGVRLGYI